MLDVAQLLGGLGDELAALLGALGTIADSVRTRSDSVTIIDADLNGFRRGA